MKKYVEKFNNELNGYLKTLEKHPEYNWYNRVASGDNIRRCHLEHYKNNKIEVLHLVVIPQFFTDMPIFGFDMVSINDKVTFICGDLSPTVDNSYKLNISYNSNREKPVWGDFFSDEALFYEPENKYDVDKVFEEFRSVLNKYLKDLVEKEFCVEPRLVKDKVNYYNRQQRLNSKTTKVLEKNEGKEIAEKFVNEVLFPELDYGIESKYQRMIDKGRIINEETKENHKKAEQTNISKELIRGTISEENYYKYLYVYNRIFGIFSKKFSREFKIFKTLFSDDLMKMEERLNLGYLEIDSLNNYINYLLRIKHPEIQSHMYVLSLAHAYGGKYISKTLPDHYPKRHLTDLPKNIIYTVRYFTPHISTEEVKKAYDNITLIYKEIWQK